MCASKQVSSASILNHDQRLRRPIIPHLRRRSAPAVLRISSTSLIEPSLGPVPASVSTSCGRAPPVNRPFPSSCCTRSHGLRRPVPQCHGAAKTGPRKPPEISWTASLSSIRRRPAAPTPPELRGVDAVSSRPRCASCAAWRSTGRRTTTAAGTPVAMMTTLRRRPPRPVDVPRPSQPVPGTRRLQLRRVADPSGKLNADTSRAAYNTGRPMSTIEIMSGQIIIMQRR